MDFVQWIDPDILPWVLPVIIFFARILDVSIGTIRIVFITRGMKILAPILGFMEVLIWLIIVSQVIRNVNNFANLIAYASGYAIGNYVGMYLENKLAFGLLIVRIITRKDSSELIKFLKEHQFGITNVPAFGNEGQVINVIFTIIKRRDLSFVIEHIQRFNPRAFYSIEDVRAVSEGNFPINKTSDYLNIFRSMKKG